MIKQRCLRVLVAGGSALLMEAAGAVLLSRVLPATEIPEDPERIGFWLYDGEDEQVPMLVSDYARGDFRQLREGEQIRIQADLDLDVEGEGLWLQLHVDGEARGSRVPLAAATAGVTFAGGNFLDMSNNPIVNVATPDGVVASDVATVGYVDASIGGLIDHTDDDVDSGELDNLCSTDGRILKRGASAWGCAADATDDTVQLSEIDGFCTDGQIIKQASGAWTCAEDAVGTDDNLGNHTATQNLNMASFKIGLLGAPSLATDAASKGYVDGATVAKALALAANGGNCGAGEYAKGVDASGVAEDCTADAINDAIDSGELDNLCASQGKILKRGVLTWECADDAVGVGDNLGDHVARQNIRLGTYLLTGSGNRGISIDDVGKVGINGGPGPADFLVWGDDGVLFGGTFSEGSIPWEGDGTRFMWYPAKAALRAGGIDGNQWNDTNIGDYSIAMGLGTTARQRGSVALGVYTTASGPNSTALGGSTRATADTSTAMGAATEAAGVASTAMGSGTFAGGWYSTALGVNTKATRDASAAMGSGSIADAELSIAFGNSTHAQSWNEMVIGAYNTLADSPTDWDWVESDRLFVIGNGRGPDAMDRSDAVVVLKSGDTKINGDLQAAGAVQVGVSSQACDAATEGAMRFDTTTKTFQGCDGTAWRTLAYQ